MVFGVCQRILCNEADPQEGCRFVERVLSVVQTLRLQQRPVLDYLTDALVAPRRTLPAPKLLGIS